MSVRNADEILKELLQEFGYIDTISTEGFFYRARHREFDIVGAERALGLLNELFKAIKHDDYAKVVRSIHDYPFMLLSWRGKMELNAELSTAYTRYLTLFHSSVQNILHRKFD